MNTKARGDIGEQIAAEYLEKEGYKIVGKNVKLSGCEIDIVAEAYFDDLGNLIKQNYPKLAKLKSFFNWKNKNLSPKTKGERTLVFVEVKTRQDDEHGAPEEAVDGYKKGRYVTAAKSYIAKHSEQNTPVRFDVIAIDGEVVNHIENAFVYNEARYSKRR